MASRKDGRNARGQFPKGVSGNPSGRKKAAPHGDDWSNFFTGFGVWGKDKRLGGHFHNHVLSFDELKNLWLGDDLASRAVETIPREASRQGWDLVIGSSQEGGGSGMDPAELSAEVKRRLEVLGADEYLEVCGGYERGYGGSALLIGANDGQTDMTQPLNLQRVRSLDWLTPLEARELMPLYAYNDPRAPKYGQPEIYQLSSRNVLPSYSGNYSSTTMLIHESRLIVFPGIRVSRYQTTTARGGWGESVLARVYRVLRDFNTAWQAAGVLVTDFAQSVIKIAGLWEALALDGGKAFQNRLAAMELGRSAVNALTIDAADSYERQQTPMSGLPDLLEKFAVRLAASCDMPLTLLFGTSPAGMNATGESDIRFFYDRVAAYQTRKLDPALRRLCQIIFRTIGNRREPKKWSVKFRPLWQDSAKDKAAAMLTQAQADSAWILAGVLSAEEVAAAHWGKGEYDPNISVDFEAREAQEQAAASPVTPGDKLAMGYEPDGYVPPPGPGSARPGDPVSTPGAPSAPDPNTPPKSIVAMQDRADCVQDIYQQLVADFDADALDWISQVYWEGPKIVPLDAIDFSGEVEWNASDEPKKVAEFERRIQSGWSKPIILVARPSSDKLLIVDGHHRALAYRALGRPALAYVATVATDEGPWDDFHSSQQHESEQIGEDRGDAWSEEAREAALEARRATAKGKSEEATKAGTAHAHIAAAKAHIVAANQLERAGVKNRPEAAEHRRIAMEHAKQAGSQAFAEHEASKEKGSAPEKPKWGREGIDTHESHHLGDEDHPHGMVHPEWGRTRGVGIGKPSSWRAVDHEGKELGRFERMSQAKAAVEKAHATREQNAKASTAGAIDKRTHGEGGPKAGGKPAAEGKHGGEHEKGGHEKKGLNVVGKLSEFGKAGAEIVGGKTAGEVAESIPVGEGGEGGKHEGHDRADAWHFDEWSDAAREAALETRRANASNTHPGEAERRAEFTGGNADKNASKAKGVDRALAHARASVLYERAAELNPDKAEQHMAKAAEHATKAEKISNPGTRTGSNAGMYAGANPHEGPQSRTTEPTEHGEIIHASHGLTDLTGRQVGGRATITATHSNDPVQTRTVELRKGKTMTVTTGGPKSNYSVKVMPTRNGEVFGAYHGGGQRAGGYATHSFSDLNEARAHAHSALDKQRVHFLQKSAEVAARK